MPAGPYVTRFVCGGKEPAGLADLVAAGSGTTERRGWGSLVVGIVTNNDDPEKLGRVKVPFPTLSADDESTWARVVTPGGGPKRGLQWLPEVDDEVLVGFELDDQTRPVVLGGLWNRKDRRRSRTSAPVGPSQQRLLASRKDSRLVLTDDPTPAVRPGAGRRRAARCTWSSRVGRHRRPEARRVGDADRGQGHAEAARSTEHRSRSPPPGR